MLSLLAELVERDYPLVANLILSFIQQASQVLHRELGEGTILSHDREARILLFDSHFLLFEGLQFIELPLVDLSQLLVDFSLG